jgi:hypothetical protein
VTDPWVSIGPDGTVYAAAVAEQNNYGVSRSVTGVLVSTSPDGGRSWSSAQMLGGTNGADKDSITADPTRPGVAYAVWRETDIHSGDDEWISRTSDAGRTWSPQAILIAGNKERLTVGDQIVVDRHRGYSTTSSISPRALPTHTRPAGTKPLGASATAWSARRSLPTYIPFQLRLSGQPMAGRRGRSRDL